jgi:hypothetical protein
MVYGVSLTTRGRCGWPSPGVRDFARPLGCVLDGPAGLTAGLGRPQRARRSRPSPGSLRPANAPSDNSKKQTAGSIQRTTVAERDKVSSSTASQAGCRAIQVARRKTLW